MSGGYTKLFSDIVDSSIWQEPLETKVVWITLLALCDQNGHVRGSPGWLAGKARVSVEACEKALETLYKPDPQSRTTDHDGRRVEALDDGWLVLNYIAFRDRLSNDKAHSAARERVRKHRERYEALRNTKAVTGVTSVYASVSASEFLPENLREDAVLAAWREWVAFRLTKPKVKDWEGLFRAQAQELSEWGPERALAALKHSRMGGYQGLYEPKRAGVSYTASRIPMGRVD